MKHDVARPQQTRLRQLVAARLNMIVGTADQINICRLHRIHVAQWIAGVYEADGDDGARQRGIEHIADAYYPLLMPQIGKCLADVSTADKVYAFDGACHGVTSNIVSDLKR